MICLAIPQLDRPYFGLLSSLLAEHAGERGFHLVIEQTGTRAREVDAISEARLRSYDGLILSTSFLHDDDSMLLGGDYPIVVLGERSFSTPLDQVAMANVPGGRLATEHLLERSCTKVAIIGGRLGEPDGIDVSTLRTRGRQEALSGAGQGLGEDPDDHPVRPIDLPLGEGYAAPRALIAEGAAVDGLFCATDLVAIGAVRALADQGLRVPDDVRVVGFDDTALTRFTTPSLTVVSPDHGAMVDAAITMIAERIGGLRSPTDARTFIGDVHLVARESTRP